MEITDLRDNASPVGEGASDPQVGQVVGIKQIRPLYDVEAKCWVADEVTDETTGAAVSAPTLRELSQKLGPGVKILDYYPLGQTSPYKFLSEAGARLAGAKAGANPPLLHKRSSISLRSSASKGFLPSGAAPVAKTKTAPVGKVTPVGGPRLRKPRTLPKSIVGWTAADDAALLELRRAGTPTAAIAERLGRTTNAVIGRSFRLSNRLVQRPDKPPVGTAPPVPQEPETQESEAQDTSPAISNVSPFPRYVSRYVPRNARMLWE